MVDAQSTMSIFMLKQKIEGERRRVHKRPEIYVTVQELMLTDDGSVAFSVQSFNLNGIRVRAFVEIIGTQSQIAKELGQEAASRLLKKASGLIHGKKPDKSKIKAPGPEKATLVGKIMGKSTGEGDLESPGSPGGESVVQTCKVDLTLNVTREAGSDKVIAKIKDLNIGENTFTSVSVARKALGNSSIRGMMEAGIGKIVAHAFTKKLRKVRIGFPGEGAFQRICRCVKKLFRLGTDDGL